jgi:hypothetical protein
MKTVVFNRYALKPQRRRRVARSMRRIAAADRHAGRRKGNASHE